MVKKLKYMHKVIRKENKSILRHHVNNILRLLEIDQREAERALKRLPVKTKVKVLKEIKKIEDRF